MVLRNGVISARSVSGGKTRAFTEETPKWVPRQKRPMRPANGGALCLTAAATTSKTDGKFL